ncbi:potassium channel protein [Prosthecochloris sp. ZM_2]|uniref:potassium channel family protein n=1 Tax=Prosthecochloris sp. ZM_2 TaxID=2045206 RepID=UPI000DF766E9|nr:potassium channel protein [Prosthecochloris sp. ZM_2]RNA64092.1 potassium channel protein [Prosthecochloris sp. ZM_2]
MSRDGQQFSTLRRFSASIISVILLIWIGTAGYMAIEGMTPVEALYMTVITLSTVGFSEVHTLSETGRIFTLALIIGGTSLFFFTLSNVATFFLSGEWKNQWERQRNRRMLRQLDNHFIICGYGRLGSNVARELSDKATPFAVIDTDIDKVGAARDLSYIALKGNAADEQILREAGIERARGLIAAANTDAENVFIVLTARNLKPGLHIVARADCEESENKLLRAGAERVVLLYKSAGRKMANLLIEPGVEEYLDELGDAKNLDLTMVQLSVNSDSSLEGLSFRQADLSNRLRVSVIGYKLPGGEVHTSPRPSEVIQAGGTLIVIGTPADIDTMQKLATGSHPLPAASN